MSLLSGIPVRLPMPAVIAVSVLGGGSILGLAFYLLGNSPSRNTAMIILAIGMICVAILLALFRAIVKWNNKRKANPLSQGIAGNAAAAPQGISEPARRARLDDLRRNFEQGVEKFRAAGKNLYSVPWYVLVGEPGSGKTEAIRHCNVGFPPGLQDQLQGAGGTLNMNWWFTNSAIILDTAGRLMFEEVAPGSTNEWNEFLKLLKQNRPNSPVNGLLLVIPVDTLIKDSADQIEKKATKIAQQFDQIQRTLGVRFPVFVIITKCDLLNGFREFFDDLNDPQLQHQMMGWSNPSPLDERFEPAKVTDHLESVRKRLIGRRQNLLLDPVNTEDPQGRRVDQVDSLFALPDSITKIGPRLRRYLEMIFVAGEWSPKPLFLRGIYFTSSMTEGAALDAELAEALGVPVDSLPGGAIFRKDRAYFLRDLFLEKVFREKGLVTRASNADKQQRSRRAIVLGFVFIAVIVLFTVTWFASRSLEKSLGGDRNFWEGASRVDLKQMNIIDNHGNYQADPDITIGGKGVSRAQFFGDNLDRVKSDLHIPLLFRPMTVLSDNVNVERRKAYRDLFAATVLKPTYEAARAKIADNWDAKRGAALIQLMKLEYAKGVGMLPPTETAHPQVEIAPLFAVALSDADYANFVKDKDPLQQVADWVYTAEAKGNTEWPPKILLPEGSTANRDAINLGIAAAIKYWDSQSNDTGKSFESLKAVRSALSDYRDAEAELVKAKGQSINNLQDYHSYRGVWNAQMDKLRDAAKRASEAWLAALASLPTKTEYTSLRKFYEDQKNVTATKAQKEYDALLAVTPPAEGAKDNESYRTLLDARSQLEAAKKKLSAWSTDAANKAVLDDLGALDSLYLGNTIKGTDNADHFPFEVHQQLYDLADKSVIKDDAAVQLTGTMADAFTKADKDSTDAVTAINSPLRLSGNVLVPTAGLAQFTVESSARAKKYLLADGALKNMPDTSEKWQKAIQAQVAKIGGSTPDSLRRPAIPLVTFIKDDRVGDDEKMFSPSFSPDVAGEANDKLQTIAKIAALPDAAAKILDPSDLMTRSTSATLGFASYKQSYIEYWRDTVKGEITFNFPSYSSFGKSLINVTSLGISGALDDYGKKMTNALDRIGASDEVNTLKAAPKVATTECDRALTNWGTLGTDPSQARRIILGLDATAFREYFVASARASDSYVARYWSGMPLAALNILANDGRADIDKSLATLANYERFPLAPAGDKKDDLSQDDILKARAALIQVRGAASAAAAAAAAGAKIIGQGGITGVPEVDAILIRLRGTDLFAAKKDYFDKLDKFLAGMPTDAKPLGVTFSADKAKLKDVPDSISIRYPYMQVQQAGKEIRVVSLISADKIDSCTLEYSGGDITLNFRDNDTGANVQTETFSGPWAILRLLASPNVKSYSRDPATNKWSVEYVINVNGTKRALWLTLEFKQPLPDTKEWPVPPGR